MEYITIWFKKNASTTLHFMEKFCAQGTRSPAACTGGRLRDPHQWRQHTSASAIPAVYGAYLGIGLMRSAEILVFLTVLFVLSVPHPVSARRILHLRAERC